MGCVAQGQDGIRAFLMILLPCPEEAPKSTLPPSGSSDR